MRGVSNHARSRIGTRIWRAALVALMMAAMLAPFPAGDVAAKNKKQSSVTPQIIGGQNVAPGHDTFMAALLLNRQSSSRHHHQAVATPFDMQYCGGTVIAPDWVLTAAHCAKGQDPAKLSVFVGTVDLNDGDHSGTTIAVEALYVDPDYNAAQTANDAALVHLKSDVPAGVTPMRIVAPGDHQFDQSGTPVSVAGWGATIAKSPYNYPNMLKQANITIQADSVCGSRRSYGKTFKAESMLCAGAGTTPKTMVDSCYGDSGGPLFAGPANDPIEIGVVSWGRGCAQLGYPGIYTRLSDPSIANWIQSTMANPPSAGSQQTAKVAHHAGGKSGKGKVGAGKHSSS